jgi:hypothetical protein
MEEHMSLGTQLFIHLFFYLVTKYLLKATLLQMLVLSVGEQTRPGLCPSVAQSLQGDKHSIINTHRHITARWEMLHRLLSEGNRGHSSVMPGLNPLGW